MPEIAEVALMADAIRQISKNRKIASLTVLGGKYAKKDKPLEGLPLLQAALPLEVLSVNTKGKRCWLELEGGWIVIISFGMTGGIYYHPSVETLKAQSERKGRPVSPEEYMRHFHIKVTLETRAPAVTTTSHEDTWYYGDPRMLGSWIITRDRSVLDKLLDSLGPDMLTGPPLTNSEFISRMRRYNNKNISTTLLEQKAVSGVGNYIRIEALYCCRISPWARVKDLDDQTLSLLHTAIREISAAAYHGHGASLYSYTGSRQEKGEFQELLKIYGKKADPEGRLVLHETKGPGGRGVYYVPSYQTIGALSGHLQSLPRAPIPTPNPVIIQSGDNTAMGLVSSPKP